jgi:hypothetical protein
MASSIYDAEHDRCGDGEPTMGLTALQVSGAMARVL